MKIFLVILLNAAIFYNILGQSGFENRCPYKSIQVTDSRIIKQADDFTITTTDGVTRNLYNTLDSGKTVFVDLFYTTCSWCQTYSPVIEEIYQNTGAGQEDIEFWGISNYVYDTNWVIDQYKLDFNVSNPCAGPWGGGTTAFSIVVNGQNFLGFPTYCVICPDRTLFFDPCYPPTVTGFDPYFEQCEATIGINDNKPQVTDSRIIAVYPNPAGAAISLKVTIDQPGPVTIELVNLLGLTVYTSSFENISGNQTINIPTDQLPNGAYFIRLMQSGQFGDTQKVWIK